MLNPKLLNCEEVLKLACLTVYHSTLQRFTSSRPDRGDDVTF